ncbi:MULTISPECIES: hypothetical protein [Pseudomonas]|uniref:Uncharacterized protein n=1 Tax=Pseudomonas salomonii TaxID=191391 RepID=A0A1H3RE39_9PSED|nr:MULTISPECIES: hypothetical protein [Pseudomonas]CRM74705.1 hypothetical protein [Pseudomonas sp. 58 R 3]SDZ24092.1 hypothetical protein SAMN05216247_10859 [Pseudomonas salomonii]
MNDDLQQSGSTTTTQATVSQQQIKTGRVLDFTWAPNANTTSTIVSADYIDYQVDTSQGSPTGDSHSIARFTYAQGKGGGQISTLFLEELRAGVRANTRIGLMVGRKWALDPGTDVSGSIGTYVLEQFDDMRASVNYVGAFARIFADPRMVSYHAGGHVHTSASITASRPLTMADSGKSILVISNTDVTLTLGDDVTEGFKATLIQAAAGKINIAALGSHTLYSNAGVRTQTLNPLDELEVSTFPAGPVFLAFRVRPGA